MFIQIKSLLFREPDRNASPVDQAVRSGLGLALHIEADKEVFTSLSIQEDIASADADLAYTSYAPDMLTVEYTCPRSPEATKLAFIGGQCPDEQCLPQANADAQSDEIQTQIRHIRTVIAPDPDNANGLYLKVGRSWLTLTTSDISSTSAAEAWEEFRNALASRNQKFDDNFNTRGMRISFIECGQDFVVNAEAIMVPRTGIILPRHRARHGPKLRIVEAACLRVPTGESTKNALVGLARGKFEKSGAGDGVIAQIGQTTIRVDCDDSVGFGALKAIEMLAAFGPATMQTFLGLMGLWIDNNPGASHETYYTARASDLMRFMGRKEVGNRGYNMADQIKKGSEVYLLSRVTVPRSNVTQYKSSGRSVETMTLDRLLHLQTVSFQRTTENGREIQSITEFRYHPNREMYDMLLGASPQFSEVSGKLLTYNPKNQKLHIVIGFGLAFYDSASRSNGNAVREIGLMDLLRLIGMEPTGPNIGRFFEQLKTAICRLCRDGVIPGVSLSVPKSRTMSIRQLIAGSKITFPAFAPQQQLGTAAASTAIGFPGSKEVAISGPSWASIHLR